MTNAISANPPSARLPHPTDAPLPIAPPILPHSPPITTNFNDLLQQFDKNLNLKSQDSPTQSINWKDRLDIDLTEMIKNVSTLETIKMMDPTIDDSLAMQIVAETINGTKSLYHVFQEKHGRTLGWQSRIYTRFIYFICYQTGILPRLIDTFAYHLFNQLRSQLSQLRTESNLTTHINKLLKATDEFLEWYLKTVEAFANSNETNRDQFIANAFNQTVNIQSLCDRFAKTSQNLPHVDFFKPLKSHFLTYLLGWFLDVTAGRLINRFILRPYLHRKIPLEVQSLINSGSALLEKNLPLVVSITQGIRDLLINANTQLGTLQNPTPPQESSNVSFCKLPDVIQKIIQALQIEGKTKDQLKQKSWDIVTPQVYAKLRTDMIAFAQSGYRNLVSFFSIPDHSEKAICHFLNLGNTAFKPPFRKTSDLRNDLTRLKEETQNVANRFFRTLISRAVKERMQGPSEIQFQEYKASFEKKQIPKGAEFVRLVETSFQSIRPKISSLSPQDPFNPKLIIEGLDKMRDAIKDYRCFYGAEIRLSDFQNEINEAMRPIFFDMNKVLLQMTQMQTSLEQFPIPLSVSQKLQQIDNMIRNADPIDIQALERNIDYLFQHQQIATKPKPIIIQRIQKEHQICEFFTIAIQKKLMDQIKGAADSNRWGDIERILSPVLPKLSKPEKTSIIDLINILKKNHGNHLWKTLETMIVTINQTHLDERKKLLQEACPWLEDSLEKSNTAVQNIANGLKIKIDDLTQIIEDLKQNMPNMQIVTLESRTQGLFSTAMGYIQSAAASSAAYVSEAVVTPSLMGIYDHFYSFILNPHLWKWAITRSIESFNKSFIRS